MAYVRTARILKTIKEGRDNELLVMSALTASYGGVAEKSSVKEDKYKHIDIWWTTEKGNKIGIDAKNHTNKPNQNFHWVEAQNVNGGKGSIYGEADYIAFNANTKIIFVRTKDLIETYETKVFGKEIVTTKPNDMYIPYTRSNWNSIYDITKKTNDIIFKMPDDDMLKFKDTIVVPLEISE